MVHMTVKHNVDLTHFIDSCHCTQEIQCFKHSLQCIKLKQSFAEYCVTHALAIININVHVLDTAVQLFELYNFV